jgi:hypothetical protein
VLAICYQEKAIARYYRVARRQRRRVRLRHARLHRGL